MSIKKGDIMEALTREEYRDLLNKVGTVAKFYIQQIEDIKYKLDFCEAFEKIQKNKSVKINDKDYAYSTPLRLIYRDNETICFIKNINEEDQYKDAIIYHFMVDFNMKIKLYIDYKD